MKTESQKEIKAESARQAVCVNEISKNLGTTSKFYDPKQ
jgi:hypothetical protein